MLTQYIITLGSRTESRTEFGKAGKFDDQDYTVIENLVRIERGFQGCTIIRAKGFYQGREEDTVQIIILEENYEKIKSCAQQLRTTFCQQSVLVVAAGIGEFLT
jgi:hypothetical protein